MSPLAYSVANAQKAADVGKNTIFDAIRNGELPARKLGRKTLILAADLEAWLGNLPKRAA